MPPPAMRIGHALRVIVAASIPIGALTLLQWWYAAPTPRTPLDWAVQILMGFWLPPMLFAILTIIGFCIYRQPKVPKRGPGQVVSLGIGICYRIVTRGTNPEVVAETVANIRQQMADYPLFPYHIEVVTQAPLDLSGVDLTLIYVPERYRTPRGTLYKARALHYALQVSGLEDGDWIVHMDEETQLTPSAVLGIRRAVEQEERSGRYRIAQGTFLYYRMLRTHPLLTMADMIRTGDDMGRFHLMHRIGFPVFGVHGSWLVIRNSVAKDVGFDFGPECSLTEDACWALIHMAKGHRFRWADGYMVEQPPVSWADFMRQRRRWFWGLVMVVKHAPLAIRHRLVLAASVGLWSISWLSGLATYVTFAVHQAAPMGVRLPANFTVAAFMLLYLLGLRENLHEMRVPFLRRFGWYIVQIVALPAVTLAEPLAVLFALVRPDLGFHIVKKPPTTPLAGHAATEVVRS